MNSKESPFVTFENVCVFFLILLVPTIMAWALHHTVHKNKIIGEIEAEVDHVKIQVSPQLRTTIDQTMACVRHAMQSYEEDEDDASWPKARLIVWDPCVQQGITRLQQNLDDVDIPSFRAKMAQVEPLVAKYSDYRNQL